MGFTYWLTTKATESKLALLRLWEKFGKKRCTLNPEVHDHEALSTKLVRKNLDSVPDEQARPRKGISNAEEPDEGNDSLAGGLVCGVLIYSTADCPADKADEHAGRCCEEKGSSPSFVDKEGTANRDYERHDGEAAVNAELGVGIRNAD